MYYILKTLCMYIYVLLVYWFNTSTAIMELAKFTFSGCRFVECPLIILDDLSRVLMAQY